MWKGSKLTESYINENQILQQIDLSFPLIQGYTSFQCLYTFLFGNCRSNYVVTGCPAKLFPLFVVVDISAFVWPTVKNSDIFDMPHSCRYQNCTCNLFPSCILVLVIHTNVTKCIKENQHFYEIFWFYWNHLKYICID